MLHKQRTGNVIIDRDEIQTNLVNRLNDHLIINNLTPNTAFLDLLHYTHEIALKSAKQSFIPDDFIICKRKTDALFKTTLLEFTYLHSRLNNSLKFQLIIESLICYSYLTNTEMYKLSSRLELNNQGSLAAPAA